MYELLQKVMCAHSMEINIRSDINISITDVHLLLLSQLAQQMHKASLDTLASLKMDSRSVKETPLKKTPFVAEVKLSYKIYRPTVLKCEDVKLLHSLIKSHVESQLQIDVVDIS